MRNCAHNDFISLHNRYLRETPKMQVLDWRLIDKLIQELYEEMLPNFEGEFSISRFLATKTGKLGRRYKKAAQDLLSKGFHSTNDSGISAFIKNEKYFETDKAPRMILGRNPKFNILYGLFIAPIESAFFKLPYICNSCDFKQCADKFSKIIGWYGENDFSKFEASQRAKLLIQIEYKLYQKFFPGNQLLEKLFALKLVKNGRTTNGTKFSFEQCRGSGDMDTSLGNGILNYIAIRYFMHKNNCLSDNILVKGDDSVFQLPEHRSDYVNTFSHFGFDAKLEIRTHYSEVTFCSGNFIKVNPTQFLYVQNLPKLLSSVPICINDGFYYALGQYYYSLGLMYSIVYSGIPVYEELGHMLKRIGKTPYRRFEKDAIQHYNLREFNCNKTYDVKVDPTISLVDISMASGMSITELSALICAMRKFNVEIPALRNCRYAPTVERNIDLDVNQLDLNVIGQFNITDKAVRKYYNYVVNTRG